jgi:ribosome-associated protein
MNHKAPISKTQRKRQVAALQDLGVELVALDDERLALIELPERLRNAVMEARRIKTFEARRRQMQYIGKLMRSVDAEPIRAALDAWQARSSDRIAALKRIEAWRERLLADPGALSALLAEHPKADAQRLRALIRNALHERAAGKPPRSFRALYQVLRTLLDKA